MHAYVAGACAARRGPHHAARDALGSRASHDGSSRRPSTLSGRVMTAQRAACCAVCGVNMCRCTLLVRMHAYTHTHVHMHEASTLVRYRPPNWPRLQCATRRRVVHCRCIPSIKAPRLFCKPSQPWFQASHHGSLLCAYGLPCARRRRRWYVTAARELASIHSCACITDAQAALPPCVRAVRSWNGEAPCAAKSRARVRRACARERGGTWPAAD